VVVGSTQGVNETGWGRREGHCHLQGILPPGYTSHYCHRECWLKQLSHKHSYNAESGIGIIIGKEIEKMLYMGVRNKYCSVCHNTIGDTVPRHDCFLSHGDYHLHIEINHNVKPDYQVNEYTS